MDVDAAFRSANQKNEELIANLQECRANLQIVRDNHGNSSDYWRATAYSSSSSKPDRAAESAIELTATAMCPDSPRSDVSGRFSGNLSYDGGSCDGGSVGGIGGGGGGGARGRAVGKRNQEIYLPDGVKLSHIAEKCNSASIGGGGGDCGGDVAQSEWIGNYNALTNMIVRTIDAAPAPAAAEAEAAASDEVAQTQQIVVAYETLKHFAQEHDREICGTNYFPEFTTNVWTNQNFKFYNTVSRAWEPLGSLRT